MKKQRIYISGQITGLSADEYKKNFAEAERMLKAEGYDVCNPTTMFGWLQPLFARLPYHAILCIDLYMLSRCDGICPLADSSKSKGARVELFYAKIFRKKIINSLLSI
jgi:hypothetical protein